MAIDLIAAHGRSGRTFVSRVAGVGAQQWHNDTPCSQWDVRSVTHHVLYDQLWVPLLLQGLTIADVGDRFEGDVLGDDPEQWPQLVSSSVADAHAAVSLPRALERTVHLSYGDASAEEYVMQLTADLAIHSWDLARATAQDASLDSDVVALLLPWTEASIDSWAGMGLFAPRLEVDAGASAAVRLLALMGRAA